MARHKGPIRGGSASHGKQPKLRDDHANGTPAGTGTDYTRRSNRHKVRPSRHKHAVAGDERNRSQTSEYA